MATPAPPAAAAEETLPPTGSPGVALSEQRAAEAFQAYGEKSYVRAVALYLEAYESAPNGSILYNVARIYDLKLGDRPLAITFYRRYIADPGAHTELIVDANQRLRELRDTEVMAARLTEKNVMAAAESKSTTAEARSEPLSNKGESGRTAERPATPEGRGGWSRSRWVGVALGALGLASVGIGAGFGLAAMSGASTADEVCQGNACSSRSGVDAANGARRDAAISNIGFVAGGALLVTGGALYFLGAEGGSSPTSRAGIRLGTRLTANDLSLQVSGKW